jgi:pyruvate,water dikinase
MTSSTVFPSLYSVEAPAGAEGWENLYNWYHLRGEERRADDEQRFWFQDRLHHPEAMRPYDEIQCECWWQGLGAFNTRMFAIPPSYGIDQRIVNGYLYISPIPAPPGELQDRAAAFGERAGHYYDNWDTIYEEWKQKTLERLRQIRQMRYEPLPHLEDVERITSHRGVSSGYELVENYSNMVNIMYETYQFHFELLNIGYAAYLTFFNFVKEAFPDISEQTISQMLGGLRVDLYRPDDELKRLAKEAVRLGISETICAAQNAKTLFSLLSEGSDAGAAWVEDWQQTSDPWFLIDTSPGHPGGYSHYGTWASEPDIPLGAVKEYITALQQGREIDRPTDSVLAERDRITAGYRKLLATDDIKAFDEMLALARKVFVYIEEHVLYIEHWMWATFWAKSHELSETLTAMGAFDDPDDMFFLRRYEVMETIYDVVTAWGCGVQPRGKDYWRPIVEQRRNVYQTLRTWEAPPALGTPPTEVTEPFTVMLWGITTDSVLEWSDSGEEDSGVVRGQPGSPGVVEGRARVVKNVHELDAVEAGDILVCPATSPAWSPVFTRVAATVSDVGGVMSHTAIICREYRLPAVVGTGNGGTRIKDGQAIRVDGGSGLVTLL